MATLHDIVFDCRWPAPLARFWAEALDGHAVAPYDDAELERLRNEGIEDPEDDPTVLVEPEAPGPRLWFQSVPEEKVVKNRVHLDLRCTDLDDEVARLIGLGATLAESQSSRQQGWLVLADPEGNEFCIST